MEKIYNCPQCDMVLNDHMFCVKCCSKWTKSEVIGQALQQLIEALKRTEYIYASQLKKHSRKYKGLSRLEQRLVVETLINDGCATKNGLKLLSNIYKPLEEELKKDDFIAWGNYETIEEAEIEWSDIDSITNLPKTSKQLADEHWGYIEALLKAHEEEFNIKQIEFHYKSAFIHGYKHAMEDK